LSARDDILKKLNKKTKIYAEYKALSNGFVRPEKLVADYIKMIEEAHIKSQNGVEFVYSIDSAYAILVNRLKRWDKNVYVEPVWNRENEAEEWTDLRVSGVKITWSDAYKAKNPDADDELYISVESLWLEGL